MADERPKDTTIGVIHPLLTLMELRRRLLTLSDTPLLLWLQIFINHGGKSIIIRAIFRELYSMGNNCNSKTILNLLNRANLLEEYSDKTSMQTHAINELNSSVINFSSISDDIHSYISSFLNVSELLTIWDRINYRFLKNGIKIQSFTKRDNVLFDKFARNVNSKLILPKFPLNYRFQNLEHIYISSEITKYLISNIPKSKNVKSILIGMLR